MNSETHFASYPHGYILGTYSFIALIEPSVFSAIEFQIIQLNHCKYRCLKGACESQANFLIRGCILYTGVETAQHGPAKGIYECFYTCIQFV